MTDISYQNAITRDHRKLTSLSEVIGAVCRMGYFRPSLDVPIAPGVLCNVRNYWVDPLGLNRIQRNRPYQQEGEKL
jgi:hypothetical protein